MKKLLIVGLVLLLAACATPATRVFVQTEWVMPEPPIDLLTPCIKPKPPGVDEYMMAGSDAREDLLTRLIVDQYSSIDLCNSQLLRLRESLQKQRDLVTQHNEDEKLRIENLKKGQNNGNKRD